MGYRRPRNKGQRCKTWQRVRGQLRCKSFTYPGRKFQMGFRPGHVPANFGAKCVRRKRVFSPWHNKKVWRCASYGAGTGRLVYYGPERPMAIWPRHKPYPIRETPSLPPGPPGYVPLSLPSFEKQTAGRTPLHGGRPRKLWQML